MIITKKSMMTLLWFSFVVYVTTCSNEHLDETKNSATSADLMHLSKPIFDIILEFLSNDIVALRFTYGTKNKAIQQNINLFFFAVLKNHTELWRVQQLYTAQRKNQLFVFIPDHLSYHFQALLHQKPLIYAYSLLTPEGSMLFSELPYYYALFTDLELWSYQRNLQFILDTLIMIFPTQNTIKLLTNPNFKLSTNDAVRPLSWFFHKKYKLWTFRPGSQSFLPLAHFDLEREHFQNFPLLFLVTFNRIDYLFCTTDDTVYKIEFFRKKMVIYFMLEYEFLKIWWDLEYNKFFILDSNQQRWIKSDGYTSKVTPMFFVDISKLDNFDLFKFRFF